MSSKWVKIAVGGALVGWVFMMLHSNREISRPVQRPTVSSQDYTTEFTIKPTEASPLTQ